MKLYICFTYYILIYFTLTNIALRSLWSCMSLFPLLFSLDSQYLFRSLKTESHDISNCPNSGLLWIESTNIIPPLVKDIFQGVTTNSSHTILSSLYRRPLVYKGMNTCGSQWSYHFILAQKKNFCLVTLITLLKSYGSKNKSNNLVTCPLPLQIEGTGVSIMVYVFLHFLYAYVSIWISLLLPLKKIKWSHIYYSVTWIFT